MFRSFRLVLDSRLLLGVVRMELASTAHAPLRAAAPAPPACAAARPLCASACAPHSCREGSPGRRDFLMRSHQKAETRQGRTGGSAGGRATHYCRFFSFFSCDLVIGCWPSCCWSSAAASCPPAASSASCKSGWQPHACCVQLHVICNVFTSHLIRQTITCAWTGCSTGCSCCGACSCPLSLILCLHRSGWGERVCRRHHALGSCTLGEQHSDKHSIGDEVSAASPGLVHTCRRLYYSMAHACR